MKKPIVDEGYLFSVFSPFSTPFIPLMPDHLVSCPHYPRPMPCTESAAPFAELLGLDHEAAPDARTQNLYFEGFIRGALAMKQRPFGDVDGYVKRARSSVYIDDGSAEGWKCLFEPPRPRPPCPACAGLAAENSRSARHVGRGIGPSSDLFGSRDALETRRPSNATVTSFGTIAGRTPGGAMSHMDTRNFGRGAPHQGDHYEVPQLAVIGRGVNAPRRATPIGSARRRLSL